MDSPNNLLSYEDILAHVNQTSCYVLVKDSVYDITSLLDQFPELLDFAGLDVSQTQPFTTTTTTPTTSSLTITTIQQHLPSVGRVDNSNPLNLKHYHRQLLFAKSSQALFTSEEVAKHSTHDDLWVIIEGRVYDLTEYQFIHPGRPDIIVKHAGQDATKVFNDVSKHTAGARRFSENYFIGRINDSSTRQQQQHQQQLPL